MADGSDVGAGHCLVPRWLGDLFMIPARFVHRANYDHIALVLAEKLRRRMDREHLGDSFRLDTPLTIAQKEGERASWQSLNLTL